MINELDRNIILFASAGTGKTFTVAKRVSEIIRQGKALPEEILCVTFTVKAAKEMQNDILEYVGDDGKNVVVKNIHGFAYFVLKEESLKHTEQYSFPSVCDETDTVETMQQILLQHGLPQDSLIFSAKGPVLSQLTNELKKKRELANLYSDNEAKDFQLVYNRLRVNEPALFNKLHSFLSFRVNGNTHDIPMEKLLEKSVGEIMHEYNQFLRDSNLLDFEDLICQTHRLFRTQASERWAKRYRYVFIDEMQDTSELEYEMLQTVMHENHVLMCGDYFQTIYEWRGSKPEKILAHYIRKYDAITFMFSENYRATRLLTKATFGYLQNTYPVLLGKYCPENIVTKSAIEGEKILNIRCKNIRSEAAWIIRWLRENDAFEHPDRFCLLARSNNYIKAINDALIQVQAAEETANSLSFFTMEADSKFFRKAVIKDIMAFFRVLLNRSDLISLSRLMKYVSGVGAETIKKINQMGELGISMATMIDPLTHRDGDPYKQLLDASENGNIVIYDTETTGLDLGHDQIIQISAIRIDQNGNILDTLDQFVIPTIPISKEAELTHHLNLELLREKQGIGIKDALNRFSEFVKGAVLVGHNSENFDAPLVKRQLMENGLPPLDIRAEYDTLVIAKLFLHQSPDFKLETLGNMFGIVNEHAHDALGDITATGQLLVNMMNRYIRETTAERMMSINKYIAKFSRFYEFINQLETDYLDNGRLADMAECIIDKCRLQNKYKEQIDHVAMRDLVHALTDTDGKLPGIYLRELVNDAALSGSQMDTIIRKMKKIPIITVHQSKGCEYDTVIIVGADNNNFPSFMAQKDHMDEEEKRAFYVAITRAKKQLIITSVMQKPGYYYGVQQSPYIGKIPAQYLSTICGKDE